MYFFISFKTFTREIEEQLIIIEEGRWLQWARKYYMSFVYLNRTINHKLFSSLMNKDCKWSENSCTCAEILIVMNKPAIEREREEQAMVEAVAVASV